MTREFRYGVYRHYKGGLYMAYGVAVHESTHERLVVYGKLGEADGPLWARPYLQFMEQVEVEGQMVNRFEEVEGDVVQLIANQPKEKAT